MGDPFFHEVTLQRLGTYLPYGDTEVFFSPESFRDTRVWENIPLIYAEPKDDAISHPDFASVTTGHLPENMRFVGHVYGAYIPQEGQPRLTATLAITDVKVEELVRQGRVGLSTAFASAELELSEGVNRIIGTILPNHVLLFEQGACPNCYPRDNGALFFNTMETDKMPETEDNETKGILKSIKALLENMKAEKTLQETKEAEDAHSAEIAQLKNTISELEAKLADAENARLQTERDNAWNTIRANVPEGWLGAKEGETRKLFENDKDLFYKNLMEHNNTYAAGIKAEGCGCSTQDKEAQLRNNIKESEKKTGYSFA
ncbi:MAG: hypothetical protein E7Z72_00595 [Methanocorpusculum parvum]|nr:hypothetical protein [Methanocorpusculum parvum]